MATGYLRKIILEEIKKVIKEQWIEDRLNEPGVDHGESTYTAKAPKMPKSQKVLELQKLLKQMKLYDGPLDGMPGILTKQAVAKMAGMESKFISSKEIMDDTDSYIMQAKLKRDEDHMAGTMASARKTSDELPTQFRPGEKPASEPSANIKQKSPQKFKAFEREKLDLNTGKKKTEEPINTKF
jgi:hypothetical protein